MGILMYPVYFLSFWYREGTRGILFFCSELNNYVVQLLSLRALISTFTRPLKNEYRKDLVLFSIIFGMAVKSFLITLSVLVMILLVTIETLVFILYLASPVIPLIWLILN